MAAGMVHGAMPPAAQQQMWNDNRQHAPQQGYGSAPVGLAAWVDAHAFPAPPPPPNENDTPGQEGQGPAPIQRKVAALEVENCEMAGKMAAMEALLRERDEEEGSQVLRKVAALEVENCEMAGKMAGMEALLRERDMEATEMKQQLLAFEHVMEGERRGEPLSKAELLKQVIALSAQLQDLAKQKAASPQPPLIVGAQDTTQTPSQTANGTTTTLPPLPPPPGSAAATAAATAPAPSPSPAPAAPQQKAAPSPAPQGAAGTGTGGAPEAFPDPPPGEPVDQFEGSPEGSAAGGDEGKQMTIQPLFSMQGQGQQVQGQQGQGQVQAGMGMGNGYMVPPPVRVGKAAEPPMAYQGQMQQQMMLSQQQQMQQQGSGRWGEEGAYQPQMVRPPSRGDLRVPASPRAGGMVPASPRVGMGAFSQSRGMMGQQGMMGPQGMMQGGMMVPASPRVSNMVPASPRIAYNRVPQSPRMGGPMGGPMVPQSPRVGGPMVPQSPRVAMGGPYGGHMGGSGYFQERPMTSPGPSMMHRSPSAGGLPMGAQAYQNNPTPLTASASFGGQSMPPMTPSMGSAGGVPGAFTGHNVPNMNAAELYGGDITANGLSAVRGSLLTFGRAKNLQAKESVLRHLDSMVEHGRVSTDEVVAGVMEKCTERMRMVPPPPRQSGGILSNLAGKAKLKAAEDEFLKNAIVAEVGMLSSTVVAFEWAPSSSFVELLETIPDLVTRRLLTLEFLNGIFGRCGKLAVAKVINELSYLDTLVGDGILPSVRELSNCMVLVMVNTKRSVEWRRKWILGKA